MTGDHGMPFPRCKSNLYDWGVRVPLALRWGVKGKPGRHVSDFVSFVDFAPTFLDYAGIEIPAEMQGESFRKIVSGEKSEWRDAIYYTYYEYPSVHMVKRHYGVRTDKYKLIHFYYDIDEWEMYDLENDPREMKNVYDDPDYVEVRELMHRRLDEMREKYGDSKENDDAFLEAYLESMEKRNR